MVRESVPGRSTHTANVPPPAERTGVVAHRGASGEYPELTLVAYEQAIAQGAEGLEIDIRLTADEVAVCLHDPLTDRTGDRSTWVHRSTVDELSTIDFGSWHPLHRKREPVMPLRQFLVLAEAHPGLKLFIETKHPVPSGGQIEQALASELRYFGLDRPGSLEESRAIMMSFSVRAARRFRTLVPDVPVVQLREPKNVMKSWSAENIGAHIMGPSISSLRARPWLVDYWRSRGMDTYVWTVDDPADMQLCRDLGVQWIGTNYPSRGLQVLDGPSRARAGGAGGGGAGVCGGRAGGRAGAAMRSKPQV